MTNEDYSNQDEPVVVPITDSIDLHTFSPKDIPDLIQEYIRACREIGILSVRIIHGKGKGIQKERVRAILAAHPHVRSFTSGHLESGGWGATCVELLPPTCNRTR
ncbi:MAG: Smr/MutS family protein [Desulfobacteraceae bacterium]|jgi:DNA-nicking Smr family endonuclease